MTRECDGYEKLLKMRGRLSIFGEFFLRHKELFANQFIKEVRRSGQMQSVKVRVLLPLVLQVYRHLGSFEGAVPESLMQGLEKLKNLGASPDRIMGRLMTTLMLRYLDDYKDDPRLMAHVSLLADYFDTVLTCLHGRFVTAWSPPPGSVPMRQDEIAKAVSKGMTVRLFSVYKGIPMRFKGVVKQTGDGTALLIVPKEKGLAAEWDGQIIKYETEDDERVVSMRVRKVFYTHKHAHIEVDGFVWTENFIRRRRSVRVMVEKPIKAIIKSVGKQLELDLIDLSVHGVCLEGTISGALPSNEHVEVQIPIPQENGKTRNLIMRGELRYVSRPDSIRRRYHIILHNDPQKEQVIAAFVAREEMRLLREIKELAASK